MCRFDVTAALDWEDGGKVSGLPGWPGVLYFSIFFCPFGLCLVHNDALGWMSHFFQLVQFTQQLNPPFQSSLTLELVNDLISRVTTRAPR
jgi:hypothetical protein